MLVSKMIGNNSLKFEFNLKKNMAIFLKNSFLSNSSEENEGGLEIIGNLLSKDIVLLKNNLILKNNDNIII